MRQNQSLTGPPQSLWKRPLSLREPNSINLYSTSSKSGRLLEVEPYANKGPADFDIQAFAAIFHIKIQLAVACL